MHGTARADLTRALGQGQGAGKSAPGWRDVYLAMLGASAMDIRQPAVLFTPQTVIWRSLTTPGRCENMTRDRRESDVDMAEIASDSR